MTKREEILELFSKKEYENAIKVAKEYKKGKKNNELKAKLGEMFFIEAKNLWKESKNDMDALSIIINILKFVKECIPKQRKVHISLARTYRLMSKMYIRENDRTSAFKCLEAASDEYKKARRSLEMKSSRTKEEDEELNKLGVENVETIKAQIDLGLKNNDIIKRLKNVDRVSPGDNEAKLILAIAYFKEKKYKEANDTISSLPDMGSYVYLELKTKLDIMQGRFDAAKEDLLRMLDLATNESDVVDTVVRLNRIYTRVDDYEESFNLLTKYSNIYKDNSRLKRELIDFYIVTKQYEHALFLLISSRNLLESDITWYKERLIYLKNILGLTLDRNNEEENPVGYIQEQLDVYSEEKCLSVQFPQADRLKDITRFKTNCDESLMQVFKVATNVSNLIPNSRGLFDEYIVKTCMLEGVKAIVHYTPVSKIKVKTISNTGKVVFFEPADNLYQVSEKKTYKKEMS